MTKTEKYDKNGNKGDGLATPERASISIKNMIIILNEGI